MALKRHWNEAVEGPALWLDGGNFTSPGAAPQDIESSAFVTDVMERMGYGAVNVADLDLFSEYGPYEAVIAPRKLPWVSANLRFADSGERVYPASRVLTVPAAAPGAAPLRIGVTGISTPATGFVGFGPEGRSVLVAPVEEELPGVVAELRKTSDLVVVLGGGGEDLVARAMRAAPDIDVLLVGRSFGVWPDARTVGRTLVFVTGDRGRDLAKVAVRAGAPNTWDLRLEKIHLSQRDYPEDPETAVRVEEMVSRFNELSRSAMKAAAAAGPPVQIAPYVGALKCAECHKPAYDVWSGSDHARALGTLAAMKRDFTLECVFCHVTPMTEEATGGFRDPASTPQLIDVQCEACHGPGEAHVAQPAASYGGVAVPEGCRRCHDADNSPAFEYASYWQKIAH